MRYFSDNIVRDVLTNYSHAEESTFGVKYFDWRWVRGLCVKCISRCGRQSSVWY